MGLERFDAALAHRVDIFRRGAEDCEALFRCVVPQHVSGGCEGCIGSLTEEKVSSGDARPASAKYWRVGHKHAGASTL